MELSQSRISARSWKSRETGEMRAPLPRNGIFGARIMLERLGEDGATQGRASNCRFLLKSLLKYQLHQDAELFERAYGYIRQYY